MAELEKLIVVVDAGHGGYDPGCVALLDPVKTTTGTDQHVTRLFEKDVNLEVARIIAAHLINFGAVPVLTRTSDVHPSNSARAALANRVGADLYLAIHCNAAADPKARGFEVVHAAGADRGRDFAAALAVGLTGQTRIPPRVPVIKPDNELGRGADFRLTVLHDTRCPAALVELGFLSNRQDAGFLASINGRRTMAVLLAEACLKHGAGK